MPIQYHDFVLDRADGPLTCTVAEPAADNLADQPALLLNIAGTRKDSLHTAIYRIAPDLFLAAGHRVLAFDMPNHGDRISQQRPAEMPGMIRALMADDDPFQRYVADAIAALDGCAQRGWVAPGRVVVHGTSRGGYCGLRLAATDRRVAAVATTAPVTDWRTLSEYDQIKDDSRVSALKLDHWIDRLVDRPIFAVISANDNRVGTGRCAEFMATLLGAQERRGAGQSSFHVDPQSVGHSLRESWYDEAARFLLRFLAGEQAPK